MLDAISDFWKPAKKNQSAENIDLSELQVGSNIGFGFVPQASLSGRRLQISTIQTYKFGDEKLTSFLLSSDKDAKSAQASMIVAEAEEEQYLAISRRISINDRMKLFNSQDIENVIEKADISTLNCKDGMPDFKGWTVATYKREMQKMTGYLFKGDYRKDTLPSLDEAQEFKYTLLVSENNEHAIEIEKYKDGRMEIYATIYRRISDIGEVTHPARTDMLNRPDLKLASSEELEEPKKAAEPIAKDSAVEEKPAVLGEKPPAKPPVEAKKPEPAPVKKEPVELKELDKDKKVEVQKPVEQPKPAVEEKPVATKPEVKPQQPTIKQEQTSKKEKPAMATLGSTMNGALKEKETGLAQAAAVANKAGGTGMDSDSVECELPVANRIIDEAIRSEMRLSDVVRRIIELPVAEQEVVHLPVVLSDEDYALLAIRYGTEPGDKNAVRMRIIEDLGSFSGKDKAA